MSITATAEQQPPPFKRIYSLCYTSHYSSLLSYSLGPFTHLFCQSTSSNMYIWKPSFCAGNTFLFQENQNIKIIVCIPTSQSQSQIIFAVYFPRQFSQISRLLGRQICFKYDFYTNVDISILLFFLYFNAINVGCSGNEGSSQFSYIRRDGHKQLLFQCLAWKIPPNMPFKVFV